jgi:hypothetical protein
MLYMGVLAMYLWLIHGRIVETFVQWKRQTNTATRHVQSKHRLIIVDCETLTNDPHRVHIQYTTRMFN